MSPIDSLESSAAPALVAVLQAVQTFITNMGTDPAQWSLKFPGACQVLIGTVSLQLPVLAQAEAASAGAAVNAQLSAWIAKLQALAPKA